MKLPLSMQQRSSKPVNSLSPTLNEEGDQLEDEWNKYKNTNQSSLWVQLQSKVQQILAPNYEDDPYEEYPFDSGWKCIIF